ncbi:putative secondary metabolism biosynthetic enzyme [Onygenales sp. PD_12]|nr:putative secondary metabolism biosynthetic enzyme [Onygenales sp. PD_12]
MTSNAFGNGSKPIPLSKSPSLQVQGNRFVLEQISKVNKFTLPTQNSSLENLMAPTEWNDLNARGITNEMTAPGLAGLPRRRGSKPIIAAVNGFCLGGGFEMVVNCDIIIASDEATFGLPEVQRGIAAVAGSLPRLVRIVGKQRAAEIALSGLMFPAAQLERWGLVNRVVEPSGLIETAVELASAIAKNSPDSLRVTMEGLHYGWEMASVEEGSSALVDRWYPRLMAGANFHEGVRAFVEKRKPEWRRSNL